eukprot:1847996-Heterocapsa_arctica.AAC.1
MSPAGWSRCSRRGQEPRAKVSPVRSPTKVASSRRKVPTAGRGANAGAFLSQSDGEDIAPKME